jgi:hypothetical protein
MKVTKIFIILLLFLFAIPSYSQLQIDTCIQIETWNRIGNSVTSLLQYNNQLVEQKHWLIVKTSRLNDIIVIKDDIILEKNKQLNILETKIIASEKNTEKYFNKYHKEKKRTKWYIITTSAIILGTFIILN